MTDAKQSLVGVMRVNDARIGIAVDSLAEVCPLPSLGAMLMQAPGLLGGLNLRDQLVPILDPAVICGGAPLRETPSRAAILRCEGRLLGLAVSEILGLTSLPPGGAQRLSTSEPATNRVVTGGFLVDGKPALLLDVPAIFALPDMPSIPGRDTIEDQARDGTRTQMMTFAAGGALFSLPAIEVYGAVPRQSVEQNSLTSGHCLGTITYHRRRVPVMSTTDVLGLGRGPAASESEIVVLRFPDDRLLGFAVDAIQNIESVGRDRLKPVPRGIGWGTPLLSDVRVQADGAQIYQIDVKGLRADRGLAAIAGMSTKGTRPSDDPDPAAGADQITTENARFLVFEAGRKLAAPLSQVVRVIEPPRDVVALPNRSDGVVGVFSHGDASLPLIDLRSVQMPRAELGTYGRVLLVGHGDDCVGFAVDTVHSIDTSAWPNIYHTETGGAAEAMIQLGDKASGRVYSVVDLEAIADGIQHPGANAEPLTS